MDRRIRYHPLFGEDVTTAANWYDERSPGLGSEFTESVKATVAAVRASPDRFGVIDFGLRYHPLARFPYIVLFDTNGDELLFLGVLHTARSIEKWRQSRK